MGYSPWGHKSVGQNVVTKQQLGGNIFSISIHQAVGIWLFPYFRTKTHMDICYTLCILLASCYMYSIRCVFEYFNLVCKPSDLWPLKSLFGRCIWRLSLRLGNFPEDSSLG